MQFFSESFPNGCKIAKVKPPFKKGSNTDPSTHKPTPLLPLVSEVFERFILDLTKYFLSYNEIFNGYQSSFGKSHSTDTCFSF